MFLIELQGNSFLSLFTRYSGLTVVPIYSAVILYPNHLNMQFQS